MEFNLKGGALLIGSLFWQDDRNEEEGKKARKSWRDNSLQIEKAIDVKVPIRYGRFSGKAELNNQTYTMVYDNKLSPHQYGTAKAVPFQKLHYTSADNIIEEAFRMSAVEGKFCNYFIKDLPTDCAWCIIAILFNPQTVPDYIKTEILGHWKEEMIKNKRGHYLLQREYELFSLKASGELAIPWPKEADGFDFLMSAATRPQLRKGIQILNEPEIALFVHQREYFEANRKHGIKTYQDDIIIDYLQSLN